MNSDSFDKSVTNAKKILLSDEPNNRTQTESLMENAWEGMKKGLKSAAQTSGKIQQFAQAQKSGGTLGAMAQSGMLDNKDMSAADDKTVISDKWKKMSEEDRAAWDEKGKAFNPPQDGWTYFWNINKDQANKQREQRVGTTGNGSSQVNVDWDKEAQNNPQLQQYLSSNNITTDQLKQLMSLINK